MSKDSEHARRWRLAAVLILAAPFSGCEQPEEQRVSVSGHVVVDGEPLSSGTVRFVPANGRPVSSTIHSDGSFTLASRTVGSITQRGLLPGNYRIDVSAAETISEKEDRMRWLVPPRYASYRTSGLSANITSPIEDLVLELTWTDQDEGFEGESRAEDSPSLDGELEQLTTKSEEPRSRVNHSKRSFALETQ